MAMRDEAVLEPCVTCENQDCRATVILSVLAPGAKRFNQAADCLDITCPACKRSFSISIFKLEWFEVHEHESARGFFGANSTSGFRGWLHGSDSARNNL
jgi:hypothetical protein